MGVKIYKKIGIHIKEFPYRLSKIESNWLIKVTKRKLKSEEIEQYEKEMGIEDLIGVEITFENPEGREKIKVPLLLSERTKRIYYEINGIKAEIIVDDSEKLKEIKKILNNVKWIILEHGFITMIISSQKAFSTDLILGGGDWTPYEK